MRTARQKPTSLAPGSKNRCQLLHGRRTCSSASAADPESFTPNWQLQIALYAPGVHGPESDQNGDKSPQ